VPVAAQATGAAAIHHIATLCFASPRVRPDLRRRRSTAARILM